ncbi:MAG: CTP-dependent riboflavin kinase [Candidatus Micrarchaeota archaeon]|nr:CTP-dependent riboflavin kinase [Candidatus Micrarchaeota archaeon]
MTQQVSLELEGVVVSGLGRGQHFMSQEGYLGQMSSILGFVPFYGTLNLKVKAEDAGKIDRIKRSRGILVKGFEANGKVFGDVILYKARLGGIECAVVMPKLSKYTDTIEVIAQDNLRDRLKLSDGSSVKVSVMLNA